MTREIPEWIGKNDDTPIPARVKIRVFDRFNGLCQNCGLGIRGGLLPAYDHIVALVNGGENRETNLGLLCVPCHLLKTKTDVAEKSQIYRKRLKAVGIRKKKRTIGGRKFNGQPIFPKWK